MLYRLGDRWSALLMFVLSTGRYRYAELQRVIGTLSEMGGNQPVSKRMLTLSLRVLERDGLVARAVGEGKMPPVDYWLTPFGEDLMRQLHALMRWCNAHAEHMRQAQRTFDAQHDATDLGAVIQHRLGQVTKGRRS
jgi:DNA-binding HxlR family transcriptional regulator